MNMVSHDSETPAHGQQVFTVCAFIHHDFGGAEKVFLPKRAETKMFLPGVFELPGGHVDFGENLVEGLKREVKEEFNREIEVGDPFFVFDYTNEVKGSHSIEVIYFAKFIGDIENIILDPKDHSEYRWFSEDDLAEAYTTEKGEDDIECQAIRKGFALLRGESPKF